MNGPTQPVQLSDGIRSQLAIGTACAVLLAVGLGGWAALTDVAGAVVGNGTIVVDGNTKKIQHPTGGVIVDIAAKEGDKVRAGDLLLRLDETVTRANLGVITSQLDELNVRLLRLAAERDDLSEIAIPAGLSARTDEARFAAIVSGETVLFASRRNAREGQKAQLRERINQLNEQIGGLKSQEAAKVREIGLINTQLRETQDLWSRSLTPLATLVALQREAARIEGEQGQLVSALAEAKAKIAETNLQIIQIDQDLKTEVMKELREDEAKRAELLERRVAAEDQLARVDIRAPVSGIVDQVAVHTIGGVVSPSETIMVIVPSDDALIVEARVAPSQIDHVYVGQAAIMRFTAFDQRTTPEIKGEVKFVSADLTKEQPNVPPYYVARVKLGDSEIRKLGKLNLKPGMPTEVFFQTPSRTVITYLLKPLRDQVERAFKED